jgi:hypothetical protein
MSEVMLQLGWFFECYKKDRAVAVLKYHAMAVTWELGAGGRSASRSSHLTSGEIDLCSQ